MIDVVLAPPGRPTHAPALRQLLTVNTGLTQTSLWNSGRTKTMLAKECRRRRRGVRQQLLVDLLLLVGSKGKVASISSSWVGCIVQRGPEEGR